MNITDFSSPNAIAAVFCNNKEKEPTRFLVTCFAFRQPFWFLTAAHCIGGLAEDEITIVHPKAQSPVLAQSVVKHPTADIAIIKVAPFASDNAQSFTTFLKKHKMGLEFIAFGFPEDIFGRDAGRPTARTFRGYFQRFMDHHSHLGYTYKAGELNIACPGGLSGGPVFLTDFTMALYGLVTENLQSTTILDSIEEIRKDGVIIKEYYQNIINYGVCLLLSGVENWLNEHLPKNT